MKIKPLFFFFLFLLNGSFSSAEHPLQNDSIKKGRIILVSTSLAAVLSPHPGAGSRRCGPYRCIYIGG